MLFLSLAMWGQESNCGDGIDNDGDGLIDCFDGDCQGVAGCEDFFFNPPAPDCGFMPPELEEVELDLLFKTDEARFPIDQRSGVVIGDMNNDGIPDLISRDNSPRRIQIFSGDNGDILQSIATPATFPFGQLAIADVDEDGFGDIFQIENSGYLARYEFGNPNAVWRTARGIGDDNSVSTAQIADINQDGRPEVYVGDRVFDALTGIRYVNSNINVGGYAGGSNSDRFPIYYDLFKPGDPKPDGSGNFGQEAQGMEYIAGNRVYTINFTTGVANSGAYQLAAQWNGPSNERDGFTSIADINGDGRMDIAVMDAGRVFAWDPYTNQRIGAGFDVPNTTGGGRINIGDFDGDGDVELGFAGRNVYIVRDYSGSNGNNNGTWSDLWRKTGLDDGSQRTGSTLFDFDGNGTVEVVYSEEENLFIYDGPTGDILFQTTSRSGTRTEYPLVADVNGDGTAEIIVTAQARNGPQFSGTGWISVYTSSNQPWVPARQVWNQHGYNVTNINDDLTVPQFQQDNLNPALGQRYNNFLVQTAIGGAAEGEIVYPAPDGVIEPVLNADGVADIDFSNCPNTVELGLVVENDGDAPFPASTPIAFYDGDPRAGQPNLFTTTTLGTTIGPGETVTLRVTIDVSQAAAGAPIFLSVNDPGFAAADLPFGPEDFPLTGTPECDYSNNVSNVGNVRCGEICGDGMDNDGDGLVDEPTLVQFEDTGCPGQVLTALQNNSPGGTYSVVGGSTIGTTVDQNGVVTLGTTTDDQPVTETIRYDDGICFDDVTVTTVDNVAPTVQCPGNVNVNLDAQCSATLADYTANAQVTDNCAAAGMISVSQLPAAGSAINLGPNTVTVTAEDPNGNSSNCTFTVTGVDRINPTIACPANTTATLDGNCNYRLPDLTGGGVVADNCSADADITVSQSPVAGQVRSGHNTAVAVTLTARDEAGNRANCSYVITLKDETPPTLTCPTVSDQTASTTDCTFALFDYRGQVRAADNCTRSDLVTYTQSPAPGTRVGPGVTTITITGTDLAGNQATCTIEQTVVDRDPPQLVCPQGIRVVPDAATCVLTVPDITDQTTITDNCGVGAITVTQSPAAGTPFSSPFFQNVTVTAVDAQGNSNICVSTILPGDPPPPTISCPGDDELTLAANCTAALPDYTSQATTQSCGTVTVTQQPGPGTNISADTEVTLTVRDNAGQTATCTFTVEVTDETPPVVTCPATQTIAVDGTCEVPLPDYTSQASTSDNCAQNLGAVTLAQSPMAGTMYDINDSPVTVTLTATDDSGNTANCNFTVELMDNQPPQISCPVSPQTDALDANCSAAIPDFTTETMVSSTCSMSGFTLSQSPAPGTPVSGEQVIPITITASDDAGNTVMCTFDYETEDVTPPAIVCPADRTEDLDGSCNFTLPDYTSLATAIDNCSSVGGTPPLMVTQQPAAGAVVNGDGTETTIILTATDAAGNATTCEFSVTTEDNTDPTVTCPATQERALDANCNYALEDLRSLVTTTDNCPGTIALTQSPAQDALTATSPGPITVTVQATDAAGNNADCAFTVNVIDDTPPTIVCPADRTLEVNGACEARLPNLVGGAVAQDNCASVGPLTVTQDVAAGTLLTGDGTSRTVTLTVTDAAGLTATCTTVVTLDDVTNPSVTCPAAQTLDLEATGCSVATPNYADQLTLSDNCTAPADLSVSQMPAAGTVLMGANTVETITFNVNDGNGNDATCSFTVTLLDVTDPVVICPANATLALDANCSVPLPDYTGLATADDDCVMSGDITFTQSPAAGTNLTFDGDQRMVTITALDGNGNTSNCTFTVVAEDQAPPMITCPAARDIEVDGSCTVTIPDFTGEASVMDNCAEAAAISVTQTPAVGSVTPADQLNAPQTVTLMAKDASGNTQTCTFTFTPVDATDPAISCPAPQTIFLDAANCAATLGDYTGLAMATDNCTADAAIDITQNLAPGEVFDGLLPDQVTVVLTAEDASGNTSTCDLTVLIRDDVPPTVDCSAANVTVALDENCNATVPDLTPNLVTVDNCSPSALTFSQSPDVGAEFSGDGATTTVTFTVEDPSGNSVTCTSTITFEDQSPPNPVVCPEDTDLKVDDNCPVPLPDYTGSVTVLDNCRAEEDIILTQSPQPGDMFSGDGTIVPVTITANDGNGNLATCMFNVTLVDDTAVELTCPGGQIVIASSDNCDGEIADYLGEVTAVNQCMVPAGMVTFVQSPAPGDPAAMLDVDDLDVPQTVTVTATDVNGNVTTCTFEVTLVDTLAPVLTCPADQTVAVAETVCEALVPDYSGVDFTTIVDNCAIRDALTITQSPASTEVITGPNATRTVTLTATDPSGNQGQCTFTLTVEDQTPPDLTCPEPDTVLVNGDCEAALEDYLSRVIVSDNCTTEGDITLEQDAPVGTVVSGQLTTETVTITATDASGNAATCDFTVTTLDTIKPMIACPGDQIVRPDGQCEALLPDYRDEVITTDNCSTIGMITLTQRPAAGELLSGEGDGLEVTIIADDGNGNRDSCSFLVRLEDNVPPTIACPADRTIPLDENCEYDLEDITDQAAVMDNCTDSDAITVTQNVSVGMTFSGDATAIPVTLTADDGNGNTAQCVTTLTLADTLSPSIVCPADQVVNVDDDCETRVADYRDAFVEDNCTAPNLITVSQSLAVGTLLTGDNTTRTITLTADDGNGNTTSCSFALTLEDVTPPTLACPDDQTIFVDGNCSVVLPDYRALATATDNCNPAPAIAQNAAPATQIDTLGTQLVTLTADDGNGNTTDCTFLVEVVDNTPPTLTCPPLSVIPADENCVVSIADYRDSIIVADNCGPLSVENGALTLVQSPVEGSEISGLGTEQLVSITATDESGNATTCMITVEVADTTRPTIVCPADTTLAIDGNCAAMIPDYTGLPGVADNCSPTGGAGAIVVTQAPAAGTAVSDEASNITITLTATDAAGNFITCDFAVQLIDSIAPEVSCPADQIVEVDANCAITLADYRGQSSATDNCSQPNEITFEQRPAPGTTFTEDGTVIPVTIVAIDQSGNRDSCEFDVTLDDAIDPVIVNCPNDSTVFVDAACAFMTPDFWAVSTATATDNCRPTGTSSTTAVGDQIIYTQSPAVGEVFTGGATTETVTLTADDGNGNTVSCSFTISLSDTISPVITVCPADTTANPNADCEFMLEDYTTRATATDNCEQDGAVTFTQRPAAGTVVSGQGGVTEITITATDANGNTTSCAFELSLQDTISPMIDCPDSQVQLVDAACSITLNDYTNLATTDDNCSPAAVVVTQSPLATTVFTGVQTQLVTLTADDGNGNTTDCAFEVSIEDEIDPVLTCPAVSVIPADANCEVAIVNYVDSVTVTDNCDAGAAITLTQDIAVGATIDGLGATLGVTITAEDQSGNTDACVITVELTDTISPTLVCAPDTTLGVDASCDAVLPDYRSFATPADNCNDPSGITLEQSPPAGTPLNTEGTVETVTITATDATGNQVSCDFTVTLIDTIAPVVECPADDVISVDGSCPIMIPDYTTGAQPSDNCTDPADILLSQSPAPGTEIMGDGTTETITITATDASGNQSTCTLTVTLEDSTEPMITCPVDQELTADEDCEVPIPDYTGDASVSSACDQGNGITVTQEPAPGTPISGHNTTEEITLTATDASGNTTSCTFNVTLIDRTAPIITDCPTAPIVEQVDADCAFSLRDYWESTAATATDNCQRAGVTSTTAAANQIRYTQTPDRLTVIESGMGLQVVTLTADDTYGNSSSCQITIVLEDTIRPVITVCPSDTIANPDANCNFTLEDYTLRASATDNCERDGAIVFAQTPPPGTVVSSQGAVTEITITATDANGNSTNCAFELTLQDTISPMITCPVDQTESLSAICTDTIQDYTSLAVVADNCTDAANITVTQEPAPGTVFSGVQTQEVTLTADDGNGNTTDCVFTLNIIDEIDPELTCPAQSIIPADADCEVDVVSYLDSVSVTDNCDAAAAIDLAQDVTVGETISGLGSSIDVTVTATDQSGNTDQCVITVVLLDTISPALTCAPDTVLGTDANCNAILPDYRPEASATDNCNAPTEITFDQVPAPGTAYSDEATQFDVTITATDATGNATSCTFSVQLIDTIAPEIICPTDQVVEVDGDCEIVLEDYRDRATSSDNCSTEAEITEVQTPAPGTVFSGEATIVPVTIVATDQSGNVDSCTFTVELNDVTPPVIQDCQVDTIGIVDGGCTYILPDYWSIAPASAQDNCRPTGTTSTTATGDQIIYTQDPAPGTVLEDAFTTQTITLTADDGNGNTVSCDFVLTLTDTISPTIICPADTVANPDAGCDFAIEDYTGRAVIADNCTEADDLVVTQTPPLGTVLNGQATTETITLTVTDPSGNETSCSFMITLQDTISPSIVCPQPKVETLDGDCSFAIPDYTSEAVTQDNCTDAAGIEVTQEPTPEMVFDALNENDVITVTLTADDGNGNTTTCDFTVTLDDVIPPVINCPADSTIFVDANCEALLPDIVAVTTATDNCNPVTITQAPLEATEYNGDDTEIVVTLTADDGNGNTSNCQVTVTLQDTISPSIVCPPNETLFAGPTCEVGLPDYTVAATIADNCTANGNIVVTQDIDAGTIFSGENTTATVTLTADDGNGNTTDCTLEITVDDAVDPTIDCPVTQTQFVTASCDVAIADFTGLAVTDDNCTAMANIAVTQMPQPGTTFSGVGTQVVTLTADDGNGNMRDCQFTVNFEDNTLPSIICPPAQTIDFGTDCQFTLPDLRDLAIADDNCTATPSTITQSPSIDSIINDLGTVTEVTLTAEDASGNISRCQFTVTTVSQTEPPAFATVTLAVVGRPVGTGLVNLRDAFDFNATTNLSGIDLDRGMDAGTGPFIVTYYLSMADADAEQNGIQPEDYDPSVNGETVLARIEDPRTGCFTLSQILVDNRTPGTSGAIDATSCSKPGTVILIDGLPMPGGQGTTIVRHEWRVIESDGTGLATSDLIDADQQVVSLPTDRATGSGTVVLEYQFFEDYGDGPVVPSVPKQVAIEILNVGGGDFFWDGSKQ